METNHPSIGVGIRLALIESGISLDEFIHTKSAVDTMRRAEAAPFHKMAAAATALCYRLAGCENDFGHALFLKLASAEHWHDTFNEFMAPAYEAFHKHQPTFDLVKQAENPIGGATMFGSLLGANALSTMPHLMEAAVATGLLTGAGGGALNWYVNRAAKEDVKELEELKSRRMAYRSVISDINQGLMRRKLLQADPAALPA